MSKELETKVPEFSSACYGVAASETHDHWAWTSNGVPSGRALSALIQLRENFRVANIGPFAGELERFHFFTGLSEVANRIG